VHPSGRIYVVFVVVEEAETLGEGELGHPRLVVMLYR